MCVVSNVGEAWAQKGWPEVWPHQYPYPKPGIPWDNAIPQIKDTVTKAQYNELLKKFFQMKTELEQAKQQDIANSEPDCEMDEKVDVIQQIANILKLTLGDIFKK